jgi:hypothetical protein
MGVDEEFGRIAPQAPGRVPRAVDAHAVALAGRDFGKQPVPHVCRALGQLEPSFVTARVEEADLDGVGDLGLHGDVDPGVGRCGAEWERVTPRGR